MRYIISAPPYDENNGGAIFQHRLVDTLNRMGETAYLWPQPPIYRRSRRERLKEVFRPAPYRTAPGLNTPVFRGTRAPDDAVAVYPEVVIRNPLQAKNIVRWILYKPGAVHPFEFTENEMFFNCGDFYDDVSGGAPELSMWHRNRLYSNENRPDRSGVCYIVRKGKDKIRLPETEDPAAIQIDGLSHAEINAIFNRCQTFISYDEATTYSQFAAICGCDSIIVPGLYDSHDAWSASHPFGAYGVAYGFDHLDHARATQHRVIEMLDAKEIESLESVRNFIRLTHERFPKAAQAAGGAKAPSCRASISSTARALPLKRALR